MKNLFVMGEGLLDGENFMLFSILHGQFGESFIYDKEKNTASLIKEMENDIDGGYAWKSVSMINNLQPECIIYAIESPVFMNGKSMGVLDDSPYADIIQNIKRTDIDNPVLFIYDLKDRIDWME